MEQARRAVRHALGLGGSAISPLLQRHLHHSRSQHWSARRRSRSKRRASLTSWDGRTIGKMRGPGFLKLLFRQDDLKLIRRAYHRRTRDGGRAHRPGGHDVQCLSESLCRRLLKSADSRNALQKRDAERAPKRSAFREACLIERTSVKTPNSGFRGKEQEFLIYRSHQRSGSHRREEHSPALLELAYMEYPLTLELVLHSAIVILVRLRREIQISCFFPICTLSIS
jgi:hypothetical protein